MNAVIELNPELVKRAIAQFVERESNIVVDSTNVVVAPNISYNQRNGDYVDGYKATASYDIAKPKSKPTFIDLGKPENARKT